MIRRLRGRLIMISAISVLTVILLIFAIILFVNVQYINRNLDTLADRVSEGGGRFPTSQNDGYGYGGMHPGREDGEEFDFITPETPFSTRHFTVLLDGEGEVARVNTDFIYSITPDEAVEYARRALDEKSERGWLSTYRYKVFSNGNGRGVVFIDGSMSLYSLRQMCAVSGAVLLISGAFIILLIALLSRRAVSPIAESYEKQKQFVTDANHELKTPLTLILTNLDIAQSEVGENEWLDDIRSESLRMTELVDQLVSLSRMDEDGARINATVFSVSELVQDSVSEFQMLAQSRSKSLTSEIEQGVNYRGDVALVARLISILLDNAVKYCDEGGDIHVTLTTHRRCVTLTVENTYAAVGEIELERLFDRFYRADKARTFTGGYGIGLSLARAIAQAHGGEISASKHGAERIIFKVILR